MTLTGRTALPALKTDTLQTLLLLNHLAAAGYLSGGLLNVQGGRWRQSLVSSLREMLVDFSEQPADRLERRILAQLLHLITFLPTEGTQFSPSLLKLVRQFGHFDARSPDSALQQWREDGVWNDAHMFSLLLRSVDAFILHQDVHAAFTELLVEQHGFEAIVQKWNWNAEVMSTMSELAVRADVPVSLVVLLVLHRCAYIDMTGYPRPRSKV